jgi:hypothetical protein
MWDLNPSLIEALCIFDSIIYLFIYSSKYLVLIQLSAFPLMVSQYLTGKKNVDGISRSFDVFQ